MPTQIAAQMYTVRDHCKCPEDVAKSLEKIKKIGYDVVQVSGICQMDWSELAKMLSDNGLTCCATHVGFDKLKNETDKVIEEHKEIGCKYPAVGAMPREFWNRDGFYEFARQADEVGSKLASAGLVFGYHNHSFEFERFDGKTGFDILFENTKPENLVSELDTYWVHHGGCDVAKTIEKLSGRIPLLHMKDMMIKDNKQVFGEVGEGNLDWPAILASCKSAGVEWYIVEQDECPGDPFESLAVSLRNMKEMGLS